MNLRASVARSVLLCVASSVLLFGCKEEPRETPVVPAKPAATEPTTTAAASRPSTEPVATTSPATSTAWKALFDGKSLGGWKTTKFGGEVEAEVKDGEMIIPAGAVMNGITYTGELPKTNYEIEIEARRKQGSDFFVGLTFPVKGSNASLICGGWGGSLVGISSIDGMDASENNTGSSFMFEKEKWYTIRQRVTDDQLQSWIDGKKVVDTDIKDHKVSVRIEVMPSRPLGIATYQTDAGIRAIRIRELTPEEIKAAAEPAK